MATYTITMKDTKETIKVKNQIELMSHIQTLFLGVGSNAHKYVLRKLITSKIPFENNVFIIVPSDAVSKITRPSFPDGTAPKNNNLEIADRKKVHYLTVFNTKNNKYTEFNSLAAAARAFDVSYSYLYTRMKYAASYKFGHLVFALNVVIEKIDSAAKLREVL